MSEFTRRRFIGKTAVAIGSFAALQVRPPRASVAAGAVAQKKFA